MKVVLCTGMMRSGSTWSFNVCRLIGEAVARETGDQFVSQYLDYQNLDTFLANNAQSQNLLAVIKVHSPAQYALQLIRSGGAYNICTIRDPRDCVASRQLFEDESFEKSLRFIETNLSYVDLYRSFGNTLFIRYEDMIADPARYIAVIVEHLGVAITADLAAEIHTQTNIEAARSISSGVPAQSPDTVIRDQSHLVDVATNLHENHIHGGMCGRWRTELSEDQQRQVNDRLYQWIFSLGYETIDG